MVYRRDDGTDPTGEPGGGGTNPGNSTPPGGGETGGCAPGMEFSELDVNGNWVGNVAGTQGECVEAAEAERRRKINTGPVPSGGSGSGQQNSGPRAPSGPARFPFEPVPQFAWGEKFAAPSVEEAIKEPGYQFRLGQGLGAIENSAAARGAARTGAHQKDLSGWAQNFASQEYGNVFNRYAQGYDRRYQTAKDQYAPNLLGWQTRTAFGTNAAQEAWRRAWDDYWRNTLSASEIYGAGQS
jgi:hypothetical protein